MYCYKITRKNYKRLNKGSSSFVIANIEIASKITMQKSNLIVALMQYSGGDFHCAIKEYSDKSEFEETLAMR